MTYKCFSLLVWVLLISVIFISPITAARRLLDNGFATVNPIPIGQGPICGRNNPYRGCLPRNIPPSPKKCKPYERCRPPSP
ncbi:hypothetical protein F0562_032807 [Nyssa sinensis]|uniref:Uncharacterized protein n=1 Tax=Nyssa sinensis TaxID=561372 RepID=A0A5J5AQZ5_9ASTE|nr:hypothetical protein F0562_032807 [Nyssa sinensis]